MVMFLFFPILGRERRRGKTNSGGRRDSDEQPYTHTKQTYMQIEVANLQS